MSSTVNKVAALAATKYSKVTGNVQAALDPATILTFVDIVTKVVGMLKECKASSNAATQTVKAPGLFARIRLRNLVKDTLGHKDFKDHGTNIVQALMNAGTEATPETMASLYSEV